MRISKPSSAFLLLALLGPLACGGDDGTGPDAGVPASLEKVGDSPTSAPAGETLPDPLAVRVTDANGDGVPGVQVTWTVTAGDGSLAANVTTTDANGETSVEWTLGIDTGDNTAAASVTDLAAVTFNTTAVAGEPAGVEVSPDTATIHAVGDTVEFTAVVRDRWGNERPDVTVAWSVSDTAIATVDSAGQVVSVKEGVTLLTAAVDTVEGLALVSVHQAPASLTVSPAADSIGEGQSTQLEAVVADSNGVPIPGAEVGWTTSDPAVATVDTGLVTAVTWSADATITATHGTLSDSAAIHALGQIAFRTRRDGDWEIFVMHADGSGLTRRTDNAAIDDRHAWSPDGTRIAFTSDRDGDDEVYVMNADGSGQTNRTNDATGGDFEPAWSPDGTRIAFTSTRDGNQDVYVMSADGSGQTGLTTDSEHDAAPAWAPDGDTIAFSSRRDGDWELYVMGDDGSNQTNLTADTSYDRRAAWSPDGSRILFARIYGDPVDLDGANIYVMNADGSGLDNLTSDSTSLDSGPVWSPDGSRIAFESNIFSTADVADDIYVMNADGSGIVRLTNTSGSNLDPAWSPDGSKIAFVSTRDGNSEIYVMNADGSGQTRLTFDAGDDFDPAWRPRP